MPANNSPIFTGTPRVSSVRVSAATTASDGTGTVGTNMYLAFTPGSNGSYLQRVRFSLSESTMKHSESTMKHSGSTMKHSGGTMKQFQKPISNFDEATAHPRGMVIAKRFPAEACRGWEPLRPLKRKLAPPPGGFYKN